MTSQGISIRIDTDDSQFLICYIRDNGITGFDGTLMSVNMAVESIIHNFVLQEREAKGNDSDTS